MKPGGTRSAARKVGEQPSVNGRQHFGQILGNQACAEFGRRFPVEPDSGACGVKGLHALRHQAGHNAGKDISGPRCREARRAVVCNRRSASRCCNNRICPFMDDNSSTKISS